eukprot:scaffold3122_cov140-Amphora_coffeaeformis.AAC.4
MASITANTKHSMKKKAPVPVSSTASIKPGGKKPAAGGGKRGAAPPLKPVQLASAAGIAELKGKDDSAKKIAILDIYRKMIGEPALGGNLGAPRAASTTRDRSGAAADLATAAKELGMTYVLKDCGMYKEMQLNLFPDGIESILKVSEEDTNNNNNNSTPSLKPSASAVSLTSMDGTTTVTSGDGYSIGTDTKRGKHVPADAREGCLLFVRALCEIVGRKAEPYVGGAFLAAALDECGSASSAVREAAEDTASAIISLAHPWAFPKIICPLLLQSLHTSEWRVKYVALERLKQCTTTAPAQVQKLIPTLIPAIANQVWDTKAQVSKAARSTLLAICDTNTNPDVKKAVPAVVNAICKPADTNKAISELMGTTFVVPVDAPTLAILCPVLARALKEKLAIHKRAACLVISNMSKLVETPSAVAPFGSLLVPELQKVSENVQFTEIRDEALKALASLTKALGDSYKVDHDEGHADEMKNETNRIEAEQERIKAEREEAERIEEERRKKEEIEKQKFKEAMDAQRELDKIAAAEAEAKRKEEELEREKARLSTKGTSGKCQACGLKKCKKGCVFFTE